MKKNLKKYLIILLAAIMISHFHFQHQRTTKKNVNKNVQEICNQNATRI